MLQMELAIQKDISQHCVNQSGYIMTASLDGGDYLFTDYLISIQFSKDQFKENLEMQFVTI